MTLLARSRVDRMPSWGERRRLAAVDRAAAQRALLARTADALAAADRLIAAGWLQDRWFAWRADGATGSGGAHSVPLDAVTHACLVGALVAGAGGEDSPVLRSEVEATWHALRRRRGPVDWLPSPAVARTHVRALTSWNDHRARTVGEVRELLAAARDVVDRELAASAARLAALA
jgi:hypothetical protein